MKKRFIGILLSLCMALTLLPTTAMAAAAAPSTQSTAKVTGEDWTTFKESGLVGYKDTSQYVYVNSFSDGLAAVFKYQARWGNQDVYKVGWINTTGKKVSSVPVVMETGDYYMRIPSGKRTKSYIVPVLEQAGNTSWLKLSDKQPDKKYTIKLESIGAAYSISYGGKYIGLTEAKDGCRLHTMDTPYLWAIEPSSTYLGHYVTIRDYSNKNLIVYASGQNTANGTHIIVWPHTGSTPAHAQIFFTNS